MTAPGRTRIVHVVHSFGIGGMEKGIATLVTHASPDVEHAIVCLARSGASTALLPRGTSVIELGKADGHSTRFLFRLARELRRLAPDVVHTRNWGGLDGVLAARIARLRNVVHGEHGWGMDDPQGTRLRRIVARRLMSRWMREATCVSQQLRRWLETTVKIRVPVTQIYNGVDTTRYRPEAGDGTVRAELGVPEDAFVVVICSRLDPIKDHPTLFRAMELLRSARDDTFLLVVGDGPERDRLEREAGSGVRFLGSRSDVPAILAESDVFALSSLNEGISNTVLEAMAAGLPVVATEVGGNPELVADGVNGTLFRPGDHASLARVLESYRDDRTLRERHGTAGRGRAESEFSVDAMVDGYESVYRRAASKRGR